MTKNEILEFISDFYDGNLKYAVVYSNSDVYDITTTDKVLQKNTSNMRMLTYGGRGKNIDGWDISIHNYMDNRTVYLGEVMFFKTKEEAIAFAQDKINVISEKWLISEETMQKWLAIGLKIPEKLLKTTISHFIEQEEKLEEELANMRKTREAFFLKYCN